MLRPGPCAIALSVLAMLMLPALARACACPPGAPACEAVWQADAVFDATVATVTPVVGKREVAGRTLTVDEKRVRFAVRQSWRGGARGTAEVVTSATAADCGVDFKPGERYLVFAQRRSSDRQLFVSVCSLTTIFEPRGELAEYLASLATPASGGRVFGTVRLVQRSPGATRIRTLDPRLVFKVRLSGAGPAVEIPVADGRFELTGVAPGRYQLELSAPRGFVARAPSRSFELIDPHACVQQDFSISPQRR
jgi:Tissue inhibitor of metalloproteinase